MRVFELKPLGARPGKLAMGQGRLFLLDGTGCGFSVPGKAAGGE